MGRNMRGIPYSLALTGLSKFEMFVTWIEEEWNSNATLVEFRCFTRKGLERKKVTELVWRAEIFRWFDSWYYSKQNRNGKKFICEGIFASKDDYCRRYFFPSAFD